jgi:hypothetical protein
MSRDQLSRRCWCRSSPSMRPRTVDLALTVIAVGAAIVAMVKCECRDCNGR